MAHNLQTLIPTRPSLLVRLKNWQDQQSWQDFVDTYGSLIHGVAVQAGLTAVEAQEVVEETFIGVAKKIQGFKYDPAVGSFRGWLLKATRWRINDQFRKRQREAGRNHCGEQTTSRTSTIERIPDPNGCDLDAIWDRDFKKYIFERALERVKARGSKDYQLFDYYVIKQWPPAKVAELFKIPRAPSFHGEASDYFDAQRRGASARDAGTLIGPSGRPHKGCRNGPES